MIGPRIIDSRIIGRAALGTLLLLIAVVAGSAQAQNPATAVTAAPAQGAEPKSRADCERIYRPEVGQSGKDVIWVPTPDELVTKLLKMAKVKAQDLVVDLGAGDGKIAIAAVREFGARSLGIEYNPDMVRLAQCMVQVEGVTGKARIIRGDIFKEDFGQATVVTMYLLPELNLCIRHRLLAMKPGTRLASHQFTMGDWDADDSFDFDYRTALLWIVPARVGGTWNLRAPGGETYNVVLRQNFQKITGDIASGKARQPLVGATLRGNSLRFAFNDSKGVTRTFAGTVQGAELKGELRGAGGRVTATGSLSGEPAAAPWATMAPRCEHFYQ
jgi:hypothetical protein